MNAKLLCILVTILTALIFGANYFAVRDGCAQTDCVKCNCTVKLKFPDLDRRNEPSCSVIFSVPAPYVGTFYDIKKLSRLTRTEGSFLECDAAVVCDRNSEMELLCKNRIGGEQKDYKTTVFPDSKCSVRCRRIEGDLFPPILGLKGVPGGRVTQTNCEHWERTPRKRRPAKSGSDRPGPGFGSTGARPSPSGTLSFVTFLEAGFSPLQSEADEPDETVTDRAWWKTLEGESGTDQGVLTVPEGDVVVRSFCSGDAVEVTGPGTITLPPCRNDSTGRWRGAYARRLPDGSHTYFPINLEIRKDGRFLGGEFTTPEGVYRIASVAQQSSSIEITASGEFEGKRRDLTIYGRYSKGEIAFDGREGAPGESSTRIVGLVRRLVIADDALPPAVAGQPYDFRILAFSAENAPTTFSLTGGQMPSGLSLDAATGTLSGKPSQTGRFEIRITAIDSLGNTFEQPFTLEVKKLALISRWLPDAIIGRPYSFKLKVVGGRPPYRLVGSAPAGLKLDPDTGEVSGTPTKPKVTVYSVNITDSQNTYDIDRLVLRVRGTTILNSHYLPDAKRGAPYRFKFEAVGNTLPIQWSLGPADVAKMGFTIDPASGELSGIPSKTGTILFSVSARGGENQTRKFSVTVSP